ncbi:Hpt domain-containing protein [Pedobacter cryophilus]|uniref:Hpt domain-containing protein n=1 Tax=Pedobacter cryophilus TaxID=2571271 RepID=A0A4U1BSZ7_9SPHI|nr:Hpt domain-containing protein [Pedobacter cryophilus]TKB95272.1 Hpt domain-containing protein [Pedobacter cryophilus]
MSTENEIIIDLTYLRDVASDNTEFMIEMIDIFLAQTPGYVEQLTTAVDQKDWSKMAELSHKIKPTMSFMGVESAKNTLGEIETKSRNQEDYEGIVAEFDKMKETFKMIFIKLEEKKIELIALG